MYENTWLKKSRSQNSPWWAQSWLTTSPKRFLLGRQLLYNIAPTKENSSSGKCNLPSVRTAWGRRSCLTCSREATPGWVMDQWVGKVIVKSTSPLSSCHISTGLPNYAQNNRRVKDLPFYRRTVLLWSCFQRYGASLASLEALLWHSVF